MRVAGRVEHGQGGARGVGEQVEAVEAEVVAPGLHVLGHTVAAVRRRVGRSRRVAGAPQVQQGQAAVRGEPAEVPR